MSLPNRLRQFATDLRRRRVVRTALLYVVAAWVAVEVASTLAPLLELPAWAPRLVLALVIVGLPVALVLGWTYDVTEAGLARTMPDAAPDAGAVSTADSGGAARADAGAAEVFEPRAPRSIAVLPFSDMSAEGDQEYLGDGIAEEILNVLVQARSLRVAARTSSFAFKGRSQDVRDIGRALSVECVLEGSVRKAGDRVRITAQLIDVRNGYHLWSQRYDRQLHDIFAIQDEIARRIAAALDAGSQAPERLASTDDVEAYDYYLRGRQFFHRMTRDTLGYAIEMFQRAIAKDPDYALAHAGLADAYSFLCMYFAESEANLRAADQASRRAVELQPTLAESHVSRGLALSLAKRYDEAAERFEEAIRLNPSLFKTYYFYARSRWAAGELEQAAALFTRALEVRPEDYSAAGLTATVHAALGDTAGQRAWLERALDNARRHLALNPDDVRAVYFAGGALVQLGQPEQGLEYARRALVMGADNPSVQYNVACVFALAGRTEEALDALERAVQLGFAHREWIEHDADLRSLRAEPRFEQILADLA